MANPLLELHSRAPRKGLGMELGLIGLGRMGSNMARRLLKGGHRVVVYNRSPGPAEALKGEGAVAAYSLEELVEQLASPGRCGSWCRRGRHGNGDHQGLGPPPGPRRHHHRGRKLLL